MIRDQLEELQKPCCKAKTPTEMYKLKPKFQMFQSSIFTIIQLFIKQTKHNYFLDNKEYNYALVSLAFSVNQLHRKKKGHLKPKETIFKKVFSSIFLINVLCSQKVVT